jgi:hypothetical protein
LPWWKINPKIVKLILLTEALSVSFGLSPAAYYDDHHKLIQRIIKWFCSPKLCPCSLL